MAGIRTPRRHRQLGLHRSHLGLRVMRPCGHSLRATEQETHISRAAHVPTRRHPMSGVLVPVRLPRSGRRGHLLPHRFLLFSRCLDRGSIPPSQDLPVPRVSSPGPESGSELKGAEQGVLLRFRRGIDTPSPSPTDSNWRAGSADTHSRVREAGCSRRSLRKTTSRSSPVFTMALMSL